MKIAFSHSGLDFDMFVEGASEVSLAQLQSNNLVSIVPTENSGFYHNFEIIFQGLDTLSLEIRYIDEDKEADGKFTGELDSFFNFRDGAGGEWFRMVGDPEDDSHEPPCTIIIKDEDNVYLVVEIL